MTNPNVVQDNVAYKVVITEYPSRHIPPYAGVPNTILSLKVLLLELSSGIHLIGVRDTIP